MLQYKLKSTQKDKVKRFVSLTQTGEQTAIYCLSQHDWKLELASDAYFQNPEVYWRDSSVSKVTVSADRKKIDQIFNKYRGKLFYSGPVHLFCLQQIFSVVSAI